MMPSQTNIPIRPFRWGDWRALWRVRLAQLAEHGVLLDPSAIPPQPEMVATDDPEWDFHSMATVYLRSPGHFWLAWDGAQPIGMVGAQPVGTAIELRRMFVDPAHRRRGIGAALVHTLQRHCAAHGAQAVELWTAAGGPGERLYTRCGFRRVPTPGDGYRNLPQITNYLPDSDEVRMRMDYSAV